MGTLSQMLARGGGPRRRGKVNRNPLRKVMGWSNGLELLECGHSQAPVRDIIGETNAARRRCWKCGRNTPTPEPKP